MKEAILVINASYAITNYTSNTISQKRPDKKDGGGGRYNQIKVIDLNFV